MTREKMFVRLRGSPRPPAAPAHHARICCARFGVVWHAVISDSIFAPSMVGMMPIVSDIMVIMFMERRVPLLRRKLFGWRDDCHDGMCGSVTTALDRPKEPVPRFAAHRCAV